MGGVVAITVRNKSGENKSFKISTGYLSNKLNDPNIMDENWMNNLILTDNLLRDDTSAEIAHKNYNSYKAVKAPYDYGFILIDYAKNKLLSSNNYMSLLTLDSINLLEKCKDIIDSDFTLIEQEYNSDTEDFDNIRTVNLKEEKFNDLHHIYFLEKAVKNNANIYFKNKKINNTDSVVSILEECYGLSLVGKSKEEQIIEMEQSINEKRIKNKETYKGMHVMKIKDYSDIKIIYPGLSVTESDKSNIMTILEYMLENKYKLTPYEAKLWMEEEKELNKENK